MREFVGVDLEEERVPDETTICKLNGVPPEQVVLGSTGHCYHWTFIPVSSKAPATAIPSSAYSSRRLRLAVTAGGYRSLRPQHHVVNPPVVIGEHMLYPVVHSDGIECSNPLDLF